MAEIPDVKKVRTKLDLTQEEFARAVGVSWTTVNRWERGKSRPSRLALEKLKRLATAAESKG